MDLLLIISSDDFESKLEHSVDFIHKQIINSIINLKI